jgi:hypothetical protein
VDGSEGPEEKRAAPSATDGCDSEQNHEPDPLVEFLDNPPISLTVSWSEYVREGRPERLLKRMVTDVANEVFGGAQRWREADAPVREWAARSGARA